MTANEIFSNISSRLIEEMMLNDKMANYYDFLGLMGFKRIHEYHFFCNAAEMRGLNRYFINHFNALINNQDVSSPWSIPASWLDHTRQDVGLETKKNAIRSGCEKFCDWMHETKRIYEQSYSDLCDIGEVAAACKVKELVAKTDMTAKCADRLHLKLKSMDYDMTAICIMQDEIHEEYAKKTKEIGIDIC